MNRSFRPGDRVTSVAVRTPLAGVGRILESHFHGVTVLWQDGTRSVERLEDLIYAGRSTDPDPLSLPISNPLPSAGAPSESSPLTREAPPDWSYTFGVPTPGSGDVGLIDAGSFGGQAAARQGGRRSVLYDDAFRNARSSAVDNLRCDAIDPTYRQIRQAVVDFGVELRCGRLPADDWREAEKIEAGAWSVSAYTSPESFSGFQTGTGQQTSGANDSGAASRFGIEIVVSNRAGTITATDRILEGVPFSRQIEVFNQVADTISSITDPIPTAISKPLAHRDIGDSTVDHRWRPGDVVNVSRPGRRSGALTTGHILRVHTSIATVEWAPSASHPQGLITQEKLNRLIFVRHDTQWLDAKSREDPSQARKVPISATLAAEWSQSPEDWQLAGTQIPASATRGRSEIHQDLAALGPTPEWVDMVIKDPRLLGPETFDPLPASFDLRNRFGHSVRDGIIGGFE